MDYQVRLDNPADYSARTFSTISFNRYLIQTAQLGFDEGSDSDANLVINPTNSPAGIFPVIAVTTGGNGANNHNVDAGFIPIPTFSIGNRVWYDTNDNGQIDADEVGIERSFGNTSFSRRSCNSCDSQWKVIIVSMV